MRRRTPSPVVPTGTSTITFQALFDASLANGGDPGSLSATQRNIQATFDVLISPIRATSARAASGLRRRAAVTSRARSSSTSSAGSQRKRFRSLTVAKPTVVA